GEAVPSDLYRFADTTNETPSLSVNGQPIEIKLTAGYASVTREWKTNDTVELNLPMPIRRVIASDRVQADRGRVAIQRGPMVYCVEWPDNPGAKVRSLALSDASKLTADFKADLLGGVTVIKSEGSFTAIPYYAWANRGKGEMIVWMSRK
ncbi:MAG TPA: hypothetical protein VH518_15285, partial [Tepidisphaeraceae bacterium]